mgnify:CR=1 FL=1
MCLVSALLLSKNLLFSQPFSESFNDINTLAGSGWVMTNVSTPLGITNWSQGVNIGSGGPFDAYNGAANAYISANFNNTSGVGTISNWLLTPNRTFRNGDVITFYTRKATPDTYPDRLEVRISQNGASTSVGSGTTVGDFTTLLLSVNPTLVTGVYPTAWTFYSVTISGLAAPTSGRIGFRYFVTNGGPSGANSDYIGIDQIDYTPYVCPAFTMTPGGALTNGVAGASYSTTLTQTGALGAPNFAVTGGALPGGLTLSSSGTISGTPNATGTYNFTVTVNDASGCSGSQSYSIVVVCPTNPTSLNGLPSLCTNGVPYTLTQGTPVGGSYSGTGVAGGMFDPSFGTQNITYTYVDAYSCSHNSVSTITVNTPPTVSLGTFAEVCSNDNSVSLTGGTPAGGSYSGVGVSAGQFDPSAGTQTITYSYTDGNACTSSASSSIVVNDAPIVNHDPIASVCENAGQIALIGGIPSGGVYSGTGIFGSNFDPTVGSQTINYTYTDGNNCSSGTTVSITVNPTPVVSHSSIDDVCENGGIISLPGGSPAGGVYSGIGISGSDFDPTVGTQSISYTYTDALTCTGVTSFTITVISSQVATLDPFSPVCENEGLVSLSGGLPAGGVYSGVGVSGSTFDPTSGTQTITYTIAPGSICESSADQEIVVNSVPTVSLTLSTTEMCVNHDPLVLSGGNPASGTFSGSGVSGGNFDPAAAGVGTSTITYTFTDNNGCSASASDIITVDACSGLQEFENEIVFSVYPNPNTGSFSLKGSGDILSYTLEVKDITGKLISSAINLSSMNVIEVNIQAEATGIYFLTGLVNDAAISIRVVVNK